MSLITTIANAIVYVSTWTAEKSAGKASTWTKYQPKEPEDLQGVNREKNVIRRTQEKDKCKDM